ncbi:YjbH domain-containing protein [Paracoccus sp. (in: a-proteobacteria)]|uniref:YjbH domain-containing protein n=1 Tax=Paracoccus sp. TaxID=267 RepID=UPI003A84A3C0
MHRSILVRHLLATALPAALLLGTASSTAVAEPMLARNMSSYGTPGGIDNPTAEQLPDGTLGASLSWSDYARRNTMIFQIMPRMTGALRYTKIDGIDRDRGYIWDRSFDLHYQVLYENGWRPALGVGLRDFMGTGHYSSEYIVATKNLTPTIRASAGLGWGRLSGKPRPFDAGDTGGKPNVGDWFTGRTRPFATLSWQVNDKLTLIGEYSNDAYAREVLEGADKPSSKFNFGAAYKIGNNYELGLYSIGGSKIGARFSLALNPKEAPFPSGTESAPVPVKPRPAPAADPEGWSGNWAQDPTAQPAIQTALSDALAKEGQVLEYMALSSNRAEIRIENRRYIQQAEAIGRAARLMTRALPPSVETFVITSTADGIPTSSVTVRRSDIERLENTEAGQIAAVAALSDPIAYPGDLVRTDDLFPRFNWKFGPYLGTSLWDPDEPFRFELGAQIRASYEFMPGLVLSGLVRQRVVGNIDQDAPGGMGIDEYDDAGHDYNSRGVPRVRSDGRMYSGTKHPVIPRLTLAWYAHPTQQTYTRVTAGLLERAYAGVSAEALWKPVNSPLAIGAEINRVRKRDFNQLFDFRDYEVTSGHVSAYYELPNGFLAQLDVGRYLAGDNGATLTLEREFANGWRVGAYATVTDMSEEEFGEGSFDKGITLSIPVAWATGKPTKDRVGGTLRSLSRDGGARVNVDGRLYDTIRDSHSVKLYEGWGKFWR